MAICLRLQQLLERLIPEWQTRLDVAAAAAAAGGGGIAAATLLLRSNGQCCLLESTTGAAPQLSVRKPSAAEEEAEGEVLPGSLFWAALFGMHDSWELERLLLGSRCARGGNDGLRVEQMALLRALFGGQRGEFRYWANDHF